MVWGVSTGIISLSLFKEILIITELSSIFLKGVVHLAVISQMTIPSE